MNRLYVLINHPVWRKTPYAVKSFKPTAYVEQLYKNQHYENHPFLSKREVEILGVWPACGPRYSILEINIDKIEHMKHALT